MNGDQTQAATPGRARSSKAVLREGFLVAVVGALLAFAANSISPRGLALGRNYFPGAAPAVPSPARPDNPPHTGAQTNVPKPTTTDLAAERLRAKGLQVVDGAQAMELFHDARYEQEAIIFVDARDDEHYQAGHIPGAFQFDHYHPEHYLPVIVPACQSAQQIVVYCNGGECEDSEFAALTLRDMGISAGKIFVYTGGIKEWEVNQWPVETGQRKSGKLRNEVK